MRPIKNPIRNLGTVLSIIARAEHAQHSIHEDLHAFGAPSECYPSERQIAREWRFVRRKAEAVAGRPWRTILRQAKRRGLPIHHPRWDRAVGRIGEKLDRQRWGRS
jgi:hypothetical protein